jgi:outer membrane protein OmpA-like peptidoglycan-associated protein
MFHKKQSNYNYYVLAGYSPVSYITSIDALDAQNRPYTYSGVDFSGKRGDIRSQLKDYVDGTFETDAIVRARRNNFNESGTGQRQWRHSVNVGAGFERRLGDIVSFNAEFKYTLPWSDDFIDGVAYAARGFTASNDALFFANLGFNFNLGLKSRKKFLQAAGKDEAPKDLGQFPGKRVAPLWMHNPLAQPMGELANPTRMNMPKSWLQDSDSDGVPDQFDLEPNTPAGAPVDTRGRTRDTDGDGVPDYLDKELITPSYCQPVDADGVGKCPDPACCTARVEQVNPNLCTIGSLPSVQFASGKSGLTSSATAILDAAAEQIKANPTCKICVVGHGGSSKREQQLSWDRVNSVINYLNESKGISRDRFVFKYGEAGDPNTVDLQDCSGEEGPNNVPPPHPQYRSNK